MRGAWLLLIVAAPAHAEDAPPFVVENKTPAFTVVNRVSPPASLPTVDTSGVIVGRVTEPSGRYELVEAWDGRVWVQTWRVKGGQKPVAAAPFRGPEFHSGHNCPVCGRSQYVVSGFNADGTHTHTCSAGHSWRH